MSLIDWIKRNRKRPTPACPEVVERPAFTVGTTVLDPRHGFSRCLSALLGDDACLTIVEQTARAGTGLARRYEVRFWHGGMLRVVRGVSQVAVGLAVADLIETADDLAAIEAHERAMKRE